jgi:hypothetical protein
MKNIPITNAFEKHATNPFLANINYRETNKITKIGEADVQLYDTKKHQVIKDSKVVYAQEFSYDKTKFLKIYDYELDFLFNLTPEAIKILAYIVKYKLEFERDEFFFSIPKYCEETKIRHSRKLNVGLNLLLQENIIARSEINTMFYINPSILFKGERKFLFIRQTKPNI